MMRLRSGMTLIECMITVAIIGILAAITPTTFQVLGAQGRPGHHATKILEAREVLVETMQELRAMPFADVDALGAESNTTNSRVPGITVEQNLARLDRELIRIELTARWQSRHEERTLTLVGIRGATGW